MVAIVFAVLAGLCWGVGEVFTKSVLHTKSIGPITAIAVRSTVALPVMWAVWAALVAGRKMEPVKFWQAETGTLLKLVFGSGLIAGAGGMLCFYLALSFGEVSRVKPIAFSLAPAIAVMLGVLFLSEAFDWRKAMGVALIIAGVVVLATSRGSAKETAPTVEVGAVSKRLIQR